MLGGLGGLWVLGGWRWNNRVLGKGSGGISVTRSGVSRAEGPVDFGLACSNFNFLISANEILEPIISAK